MKKYIYGGVIALFVILLAVGHHYYLKTKYYKELYNREYSNVKAFEAENDSLKNDIRQFQYTMTDLKQSKDTINQKIVQVIKEGGIKEKNVHNTPGVLKIQH